MAFAPQNSDLSYWQKQSQPLFPDIAWNIPEQKTGRLAVVGGNSQNFSTVVRISEFASQNFPFTHVATILPDVLRAKLPPLGNLNFLPSTTSGSLAKSHQLQLSFVNSDASLIIGDLSKNSATAVAILDAIYDKEEIKSPTKPLVLARDTVDLLANDAARWLVRSNTFVIASMIQLQKVFRAIYYPRMIMLSQPLLPTVETLHKFTLSYPEITILTFHQENIIIANAGKISTTHIVDTDYSPISLWSGQLATTVAALNLYNPQQNFAATTAAVLYH